MIMTTSLLGMPKKVESLGISLLALGQHKTMVDGTKVTSTLAARRLCSQVLGPRFFICLIPFSVTITPHWRTVTL